MANIDAAYELDNDTTGFIGQQSSSSRRRTPPPLDHVADPFTFNRVDDDVVVSTDGECF